MERVPVFCQPISFPEALKPRNTLFFLFFSREEIPPIRYQLANFITIYNFADNLSTSSILATTPWSNLSLSLSQVFPVLLVGRSFNLFPGQNRSTWSELLQSKYWSDIPRLELVSNQPIFSPPPCQRDETPEADFTFVDKAATRIGLK